MEVNDQGVASCFLEEDKDTLDLNKVPSKSDSSSAAAAAGSDYFSALGNAGNTTNDSILLMCDNNAESRDNAVASDFIEDTVGQGLDDEKRLTLVFPNSDISHEGMAKSQPSKCREDDAGLIGGDQCVSIDGQIKANDVLKKRRGRKKKVVYSSQSPRPEGLNSEKGNEASKGRMGKKRKVAVTISCDKDLEAMSEELIHVEARKERSGRKKKALKRESLNDEKEPMLGAASEENSSCLESQLSEKNWEESSESNVAETSEDVDFVEAEDAGHNTKEDVQKFSSRRRGRKKKVKERLRESDDDEIIYKKAVTSVTAAKRGTVGRVLRSRTHVEAVSEKQAHAKGSEVLEGIELEKEEQASDGEGIEMKMDVSARFKQGMKDLKKRRGRPPKLHKEKGSEKEDQQSDGEDIEMKMDVSDQFKQGMENLKKRRGRPPKLHKEKGLEEEDQQSDGEDIEMKIDVSVQFKQGMKDSKKRRGRPPKLHKEKGLEKEDQQSDGEDIEIKTDVSAQFKLGKKDLIKRRGRPPKLHKEKGLEREDQPSDGGEDIEMKLGAGAQFKRGMKDLKKRRGRPPKLHKEEGNPNVCVKKKVKLTIPDPTTNGSNSLKMQTRNTLSAHVDNEKKKIEDSKESNNQLATVSEKHAGDSCQSYPEGGPHHSELSIKALDKSECKKNNDGALSRSEEKQLVRDQIVSILNNAGWTIQLRPRMGREYHDAVYVDNEGKTYWSVTLAYKTLRASVQNGTADTKAVAAFIPIPEEKLSMLFRNSTGKRGQGKKKEKVNKAGKKKENVNKAGKKILKENLKKPSLKRGRPKSNRRTETKRRCALLARRSEIGLGPDSDGFIMNEGKMTLLSWMIDSGTLPPGAKIQLMKGTEKNMILEGKINQERICCGCCDTDVTLSVFQAHAGCINDQPFDSIYLDSGLSLSQCLTDAWRKHVETNHDCFHLLDVDGDDPNDDTCNLCGDGGDLICCDGCPSTFHQSCLRIQNCPSGDWQCVYCSCKFCEMIDRPCLRDDVEDTDNFSLLACLLCEEKFHIACIPEEDDIHNAKEGILFCGSECQKIFERLQKVLGVRHELEDGFSWTILRCQDVDCKENCGSDSAKIVCNSKLVLAFSIMDECFSPIIDPRSPTNMIQRVVFNSGSNLRRMNYSGFCTIILERGEELVAAASIRIHGNQLAEMPFIGTRNMYRRQGMCRRLLSAIEMALSSFDVEKLVIPAIQELNETWTNVFGFTPVEDSERQDMKYMSLVVFPGTDLLQKPMCKHEITAVNLSCGSETRDEKSQEVSTPSM